MTYIGNVTLFMSENWYGTRCIDVFVSKRRVKGECRFAITAPRPLCVGHRQVSRRTRIKLFINDTDLELADAIHTASFAHVYSPCVCIAIPGRYTRLAWLANLTLTVLTLTLTVVTLATASRVCIRLYVCTDSFFGIISTVVLCHFGPWSLRSSDLQERPKWEIDLKDRSNLTTLVFGTNLPIDGVCVGDILVPSDVEDLSYGDWWGGDRDVVSVLNVSVSRRSQDLY